MCMITKISDVLGHQTEMGQLKIRQSECGPIELTLILRLQPGPVWVREK